MSTWNHESCLGWKRCGLSKTRFIPFVPEKGISICVTVLSSWESHDQISALYSLSGISACFEAKAKRKSVGKPVFADGIVHGIERRAKRAKRGKTGSRWVEFDQSDDEEDEQLEEEEEEGEEGYGDKNH